MKTTSKSHKNHKFTQNYPTERKDYQSSKESHSNSNSESSEQEQTLFSKIRNRIQNRNSKSDLDKQKENQDMKDHINMEKLRKIA
jgi:hypothetical protein